MNPKAIAFTSAALALLIIAPALFLSGCGGEKMAPVPAGQTQEYRDPAFGFRIQYPVGWVSNSEVGRATFFNAQGVANKFLDPTGNDPYGVKISIDAVKTGDTEKAIQQMKDDLTQTVTMKPGEPFTIANHAGTKIPYVVNYGGDNMVTGYAVLVGIDSLAYELNFAGFGQYFNAYTAVFDSALKSFQPPKPVEKGRDPTLPAEAQAEYATKLFTFKYPENFEFVNAPKGTNELVVDLHGGRLDCTIRFDVFGAKGLTLDKVFDQNKALVKQQITTGKATIGDQPASFLTYSATRDVERRFYFVVRNDKVYRITFDWFKPQSVDYLKAYDLVLRSIKFK